MLGVLSLTVDSQGCAGVRVCADEQDRGVFKSVGELETAIMDYLDQHNAQPKPFVWTKSAGEMIEKVARAKQALESQH